MLLADNDDAKGQTFNIGSATPIAVDRARPPGHRALRAARAGSSLVPYDEAYGDGFEELGTRRPDTTALRNLTGWQTRCTVDDAIDDVIVYERARADAKCGGRGRPPMSR